MADRLGVAPPPAPEIAIDPERAPELDDGLDDAPELRPVEVSEAMVAGLLRGLVGGSLHFVLGDPDVPEHWQFSDDELADMVPPLTRVINRRPEWAAAVARGDEVTVALVLARFGIRNLNDGRRARRARDQQAESPGAAGTGDGALPGAHQNGGPDPRAGAVDGNADRGGDRR